MTKFATQFSPRKEVKLTFTLPSLTKQSPVNEVDINKIMERYIKASGMSADEILKAYEALYLKQSFGDATAVPDFETAQNMLVEANGLFESLPAKIRERFANSPANFLAFMADDANIDEAVRLGLAVKKVQPVEEKSTVEEPAVATQTAEATSSG